MINLGHEGLNRLPEATKERISAIIANFYSLNLHHEVTSIILLSYCVPRFFFILEELESWQSEPPGRAVELVNQLNLSLVRDLRAQSA